MSPPLSVEIAGDGPPDIVLVPGLGDPKEAWSRVAPLLAARSARVVMVDNPGVGGSSAAGAPATTAAMAGPVAAAVAQVAGGRPVHLVGHSMGGMVAQEVALARAELVSGLTLCCTYAAPGAFCAALVASWRAVARALGVPEARRQLLPWAFTPAFFVDRPDEIEAIDGILDSASPRPDVFLAQLDALDAHDARERLPGLAVPVTVVAAERDILIPADRSAELAALIPGARSVAVPGGHACFWERPEGLAAAIAAAAGL